jgi:hypothetical protein
MSLLSIIQNVCHEMGLTAPTVAMGATDNQTLQLVALMQREGKELASHPVKDSCWTALQKLYLFNTFFVQAPATEVQGSNVLTLASTAGIKAGFGVSGPNLPNACTVSSVTPTTVTLDPTQTATASGNGTDVYTFSQIAYPLPPDYDHSINQTMWDRSFRWQMLGPLSPQEWQVLKSGIAPTGPRIRWRIDQGVFLLDPYPTAIDTLAFEYIGTGFCQSAAGVAQSSWQADTDVGLLSEDLMTLGLKWRFLRAKGLSYAEERETYDRAVERAAARDGGARTLALNRTAISPLLNNANIPDTGYGVPSA